MMQITESLSRKIKVLSFWAMLSVLSIHSNTLGTFPEAASWNVFIQRFLTRSLTDWAVPFFFILSGFWFSIGKYDGWVSFLKKKSKTLLIPYICWAIVGAVIVFPLIIFNNKVNNDSLFARTFLGFSGIWQKINRLLGITIAGPCGNLALWYVRTLLVFFIFAPLWKQLEKCGIKVVVTMALFLVLLFKNIQVPFLAINFDSIGWILLGVGISKSFILADIKIWNCLIWVSGVLWMGGSVFKALEWWRDPFNLIPLSGCFFIWYASNKILKINYAEWLLQSSFFVYCLHGALVGYILGGIPFIFGKTNICTLITTLFTPFVLLGICLIFAKASAHFIPRVYQNLCGGRCAFLKK